MSLSIASFSFLWVPSLLLIFVLFPFLLLSSLLIKPKKSRPSLPPGPPKLPIIGHLHHVNGELLHRRLWQLSHKHGPLMQLQLGRVPTLVVSSAEMAREVMKTLDSAFCNRAALTSFNKLSYDFSDIAFSPYTDYYREMRKICNVQLLSAKKVQSFTVVREEEVASMVRKIASVTQQSSSSPVAEPVNLSKMLISLMYNISCRVAFGKIYEARSEVEKMRFWIALEEAGKMLGEVFVGDFLPWLWWVDVLSGVRGRLERCFLELDVVYERVIDDHVDPRRVRGEEKEDLVDALLRVQKDFHLSRDQIKGVLMNILIGGTETSSAGIVWAMAELVRNPTLMKKAQDEVRGIFGKKEKVEENGLHQLQYLKSVIKETLRLHPPGPLTIPRETRKHCNINQYEVLPKTLVHVNLFAIGRDPQFWENPDEFLPERFMNSSIDYKGQDFNFIPFGAGRRNCLGIHFATATMQLVLASLLYSFDWKLPTGVSKEDMDMSEAPGIVMHKKYDLQLVPTNYFDQKMEN